jgi:hypothetical protein
VLKKYQAVFPHDHKTQLSFEKEVGIVRVPSTHAFDIEVQVVCLNQLRHDYLDPRLRVPGLEALTRSDAMIVNIDYPLGMAAYQVLA